MGDPVAKKLPLRHPAEIPMFILMVVLNFAILAVLIVFLVSTALIPAGLRDTNWEATIRAIAGAILLVAPAILLVRQVQRASIRGTAVQLSRTQFPDLYASMDNFAATLRVKPTPTVYLSNGNGTLNAFAAQSGWTNNYVVLSNELFANLRNDNREGTRFILGHEIAHIRLHHVALWYNLVLCYSQLIPILGSTLSRLREYSCDRNGAALEPKGEVGLILLAAGRYAADNVQVSELVDQGRDLGGFWVELSQLTRSHPWTVRRIWRLNQLGLFGAAHTVDQTAPP
jgi:Zn-dependent protease with chaperone function